MAQHITKIQKQYIKYLKVKWRNERWKDMKGKRKEKWRWGKYLDRSESIYYLSIDYSSLYLQ